ncbi:MAG: hypothetical protein NVSMB23_26820 [Myxococcales bacterium]
MTKTMLLAAAFAACVAGPALAAPSAQAPRPLSLRLESGAVPAAPTGLSDLGGGTRRETAAVIATDAIYGGIAGLAIGAGVALIDGGHNWARDLSVGAGAGLLVGAVIGAVDATSQDRIATVDVRERSTPLGPSLRSGVRF